MICFLTCMFTLLQICLVPSKAMLFPPKNLTVGLLDFKATAEWLPGQGNPPGTKYTLEFITAQNMSGGKWIRSPHCTNIAILKCELTFDRQPDELFWNYFVRVKTTFKGSSSNWTTTSKSFQPYGDTRLSSPDVNISDDQKSIKIYFRHWLELKPGIKPLEFQLYLFEKGPEGESKFTGPISTSKSPYIFSDMPFDKNYCVSVSASHQQASKNNNFNTTKCICLLGSTRSSVLIVCIVAILLITFITGIIVTVGCFCDMNLINRRIPDALIIFPGYNWVLKITPEIFQTMRWTWQKKITEDYDSAPEEESNDGSQYYHPRENLTNVIINPSSNANFNQPEQAEEAETSNQCYRNTLDTDLEQSEESEISEKDDDNDDDIYSVAPVSLCTCTSNHIETSNFLQAIPVNKFVNSKTDRYCAEETPCFLSNDCERKVPAEEKEEDEDISLLADYSSESMRSYEPSYEPRHDINQLEMI